VSSPEGDWAALAHAVADRRRELGIPTQEAAARKGDVSKSTWQRLENGQPIGMNSLVRVAEVLCWDASTPLTILGCRSPQGVRAHGADLSAGPALVFVSVDGTAHPVDVEDWHVEVLSPRDRVVFKALLARASGRFLPPGPPPKETL
jgi:hypothetical protein